MMDVILEVFNLSETEQEGLLSPFCRTFSSATTKLCDS